MLSAVKTQPDITALPTSPATLAELLNAALEHGDPWVIEHTVGTVSLAMGGAALRRPTLTDVLDALARAGLQLRVECIDRGPRLRSVD